MIFIRINFKNTLPVAGIGAAGGTHYVFSIRRIARLPAEERQLPPQKDDP